MNITLHRTTLMVCMLAGTLALTIALVAAKDVSAAPSPERAGGATQISGDARLDVATPLSVPIFRDTTMPSSCMGTWKVVYIQPPTPT